MSSVLSERTKPVSAGMLQQQQHWRLQCKQSPSASTSSVCAYWMRGGWASVQKPNLRRVRKTTFVAAAIMRVGVSGCVAVSVLPVLPNAPLLQSSVKVMASCHEWLSQRHSTFSVGKHDTCNSPHGVPCEVIIK